MTPVKHERDIQQASSVFMTIKNWVINDDMTKLISILTPELLDILHLGGTPSPPLLVGYQTPREE